MVGRDRRDAALLFLAYDLLQRAAARLDADRQHDQCRGHEASGAQGKHAGIADRADNVADHNRARDGADPPKG